RWACCIAWLARGRASWPCVNEVYGLLRDGHGPSEGPVEAAAGNGGFPAVGGLVHPGSATVEPGLGIGHECPIYVSEAAQLRAGCVLPAPRTGSICDVAQAPTTSVPLPAS